MRAEGKTAAEEEEEELEEAVLVEEGEIQEVTLLPEMTEGAAAEERTVTAERGRQEEVQAAVEGVGGTVEIPTTAPLAMGGRCPGP